MEKDNEFKDNNIKLVLINLEDDREHPAIGLISIATYLEENSFKNTTIIDRCFEEDLIESISKISPTIVGISSKTVHYALAIETAKKIKEKLPKTILLIGGPHITTLPISLDKIFDIGIIGEGEETILELIQTIKNGNIKYKDINGLVYYENEELKINIPRKSIIPLDNIPSPNLNYVNSNFIKKINSGFNIGNRGFIITSRGCPFRCIYCSTTRVWDKLRFNSPERIVKDIKNWINKYNVNQIRVMDDLFTISVDHLKKIKELMAKEEILGKVGFIVSARTSILNEELCQLCKDIGVKKMNFGFDSGNERVLKMLKGNNVNVEQIKNSVILCNKYNILVEGSFIFATPTETIEEMTDTLSLIKWMIKYKNVESIWTFIMTPLPATEIWTIAEKRGKVSSTMDWRILSYYRENDPLVLDANYDEFIKLWDEVKKTLKILKWRRVRRTIIQNPFYVIEKTFSKPKLAFNLIFHKKVIDQENIKEK